MDAEVLKPYNPNGTLVLKTKLALEASFEFVDSEQYTATLIRASTYDQQMRETIRPKLLWAWFSRYPRNKSRVSIQIGFVIQPAPLDQAYDVIIRYNGQDQNTGSISLSAGKATVLDTGGDVPAEWVGWKVNVILRLSLDVAVRTVDCFDIWGKDTTSKRRPWTWVTSFAGTARR